MSRIPLAAEATAASNAVLRPDFTAFCNDIGDKIMEAMHKGGKSAPSVSVPAESVAELLPLIREEFETRGYTVEIVDAPREEGWGPWKKVIVKWK